MYQPVYVWVPMVTLITHPIVCGAFCALNNIENMYRARLGWTLIQKDFIELDYPYIVRFLTWLGFKPNNADNIS